MKRHRMERSSRLPKAPTGIQGLDEVTGGGLPRGRPTLVCGSAGCGKTLLAMEFLVRGATEHDEPGVFMAFEERGEELAANFASLGHDLDALVRDGKVSIEFVHIERSEIEETGEYDLEGLFIRLGYAIDRIGAKRVVLDTVEALFSGLSNTAILRAELRRLFRWLKNRGVTAVITGERGDTTLTRYGLEEYVADCVILLDHRVADSIATRRIRVVKYRGSTHGTSEYPFLIDERGLSIVPITSLGLNHPASTDRVSTGIGQLDAMLGGRGLFRGSTVLVSGTAGAGKTSVAAQFAHAAAARKERCIWFAFEESPAQIARNMRSIGLDLDADVRGKHLRFHAERPTAAGLEMHLVAIHKLVRTFDPAVVVIDPITNLTPLGTPTEIKALLTRLIDFLKTRRITALLTSLTAGSDALEETDVGVSSLTDAWLLLRDVQSGAERNRVLHLLKCRGMAHSNQVREFLITDRGVELQDVYVGPSGELLTGSARVTREAIERAEALERAQAMQARVRDVERRRTAMDAQIAAMRATFEADRDDAVLLRSLDEQRELALAADRERMRTMRQADAPRGVTRRRTKGGKAS